MWQVNGFDRRCFQLGRGFRISPGAVTAVTSHEGSLEAALEAACNSIDRARGKGHLDALAESLQQKVKLQCQAYQRLDGSQDLRAAEQQIEKEAANFHQANFSKGVALMRISLAHIDLQRGGLCRCSSAAELALDAMAELSDVSNEDATMLEAQLLRATALLACGDPRAQADAHDVLEKSRRLGDRRWEANALHVFGLSKAFQGTFSAYEDALRSLCDAQRLCFDLQMWRSHVAVELSMARLYLESQQPEEAIRIAEEALVLIQDMGDFHSEYIAYGLLCQAILDTDSNVSQAQVRAREAVERFRLQGPRPHALALNLLAGVLSETDPQSARAVVQDALVICRKLQDEELEAQILLRLSSVEAANDQDDATLQALETAIALYQRLPETSEAIACARYLSISVLLRMFDPKESLKEAANVRAFFAEEKDAHREALTLVAVASISFTRNDLEDAKESLELARELFSGVADVRGELLALTTLAEMHRSNGEIAEASQMMQRCRAMAKEAGWKDEEVRILVDLSNLQRTNETSSVKSSARLAREGLRMAKQIGNLEGQAELLMQCVQCNLLLASEKLPSRNLLEETQRLAADAVRLTTDGVGWRRRLKGLALYWQAHSIALKDTTEALKHLEALVDFCRSKENVGLEAHTRLLEAQIYLSRDKAKALEILRPAAETLKKLGDVNGMEMAEQVLQRASPPKQPARPTSDLPPALMDLERESPVVSTPARSRLDMTSIRKLILDLAADAVASEEPLHDDTVLMDSGMDSLTSVAFRNDLQSKLNVDLPASLIFEYPSVGELTRLVVSLSDQ